MSPFDQVAVTTPATVAEAISTANVIAAQQTDKLEGRRYLFWGKHHQVWGGNTIILGGNTLIFAGNTIM